MSKNVNDHYQTIYTKKLTPGEIEKGEVSILLDPYRISSIYKVNGSARDQILKKALRWTAKGHSEKKVLKEIISCAQRKLDMIEEDNFGISEADSPILDLNKIAHSDKV